MMEKNEIACEKMRRIEIAPSLFGCDFRHMEEEIKKAEKAGADRLHLDVMDGVFVPNISFGQVIVEWVRKVTSLYLDAHLMIEKPHRYFESFKRVGVDQITFHVEEYGIPLPPRYTYPKTVEKVDEEELEKRVKEVKELGLRVALAFNPGTPILAERIFPLLDEILIMTVLGGLGSISGAIIGAAIYTVGLEFLRVLEAPFSIGSITFPGIPGMRMVVLSLLLILLMLFWRRGIMGRRELSWNGLYNLLRRIHFSSRGDRA